VEEVPVNYLIVLHSYHHRNTEKIAKVFAKVLDAQITAAEQTNPEELREYGIVGFGSGIDSAKHYKPLLDLVDRLPPVRNKKAFIFSTCGAPAGLFSGEQFRKMTAKNHTSLRGKLQKKGYVIIDEFSCAGFNTNSFLRFFGGLNNGRPDAEDLKHAEEFAQKLMQYARIS
jgi:flavodoxin